MWKVRCQGWTHAGVELRPLHPISSSLLLLLNREYKWVGERKEQEMDQKKVQSI